jgi:hypothetical protein
MGAHNPKNPPLPTGVLLIALLLFAAGAELLVLGLVMLLAPGRVSMSLGAPLLGGLELAGPYAFLMAGAVLSLTGFGLWRLHAWARWAAILIALAGIIGLVPRVSGAVLGMQWESLLSSGVQVILRVLVLFYLTQGPVADAFQENARGS